MTTKEVYVSLRCTQEGKNGPMRAFVTSELPEQLEESDLSDFDVSKQLKTAVFNAGISLKWKVAQPKRRRNRIFQILRSSSGVFSLKTTAEQLDDSCLSDEDGGVASAPMLRGRGPAPTLASPAGHSRGRSRKTKERKGRILQVLSSGSGEYILDQTIDQITDSELSEEEDDDEILRLAKSAGILLRKRPLKRSKPESAPPPAGPLREPVADYGAGGATREYRNRFRKAVLDNVANPGPRPIHGVIGSFQPGILNRNTQQPLAQLPPHTEITYDQNMPASVPPVEEKEVAITKAKVEWFDEDCLHDNEVAHFSKLFPMDDEKNVAMYWDVRNEVITLFKFKQKLATEDGSSSTYLSSQECRVNMNFEDDAALVFEVWRTLSDWGVINFQSNDVPIRLRKVIHPSAQHVIKTANDLPIPLRNSELINRIYDSTEVSWETLEGEFENPLLSLLTAEFAGQRRKDRPETIKPQPSFADEINELIKILQPAQVESKIIQEIPIVEEGRVRTGLAAEIAVSSLFTDPERRGDSVIKTTLKASEIWDLLKQLLKGITNQDVQDAEDVIDLMVENALVHSETSAIDSKRQAAELSLLIAKRFDCKYSLIETIPEPESLTHNVNEKIPCVLAKVDRWTDSDRIALMSQVSSIRQLP